ncbi:DegT/DnrJ/EryC1/StrS family aminotransferase [Fluviispira vulneris]|uniref:DegT/DnrJ/EryC1/StrS family aminotransferase n=1 Tax=Fluviispira vulneris TaxID=2763012 RepID=UPI001647E4F9|nr:DegT/DnrJ/EryC1/StrS family aminotransferase [Fluviispira vulneris]
MLGYLKLSNHEKELVNSIYYNKNLFHKNKTNIILPPLNTFYFGYCRNALYEALVLLNVMKGDKVLLPSFICKDLLSAINSLSAEPVFYDVNENFDLIIPPESLPKAKVIIAVNYFGFPQTLDKFKEYCSRNNCYLIEDNAHGFLSKDEYNNYLGTRGDIGIFSFRKTLPLESGAALLINNKLIHNSLNSNSDLKYTISLKYKMKNSIRKTCAFCGLWHIYLFIYLIRMFRKIKTGNIFPVSDTSEEYILPKNKLLKDNLMNHLNNLNIESEIERRRKLYFLAEKLLINEKCIFIYKELPKNVAPYLFPFYCQPENIDSIKRKLAQNFLFCFPWPDLPQELKNNCPDYYKNIWGVSFQW